MENKAVGIGLFNVIAAVVSYHINQSILWAFLHGIFGVFYLIYAALTGQLA